MENQERLKLVQSRYPCCGRLLNVQFFIKSTCIFNEQTLKVKRQGKDFVYLNNHVKPWHAITWNEFLKYCVRVSHNIEKKYGDLCTFIITEVEYHDITDCL